ncbi:nucleoside triphosphate pyrophosphohydrolase [Agaribacterium sp. ZY112]|uniref:nucleoside triphosphate pyrophosphohydrolase n=1 Tax=Agaribacterium sp. ZY112 TaxID=3233574 RepID=UPI003523B04D
MSYDINDLVYLMQRLRKPQTGCPWDLEQDFRSITASTLEEAYEVVDAIERDDIAHLKEELGDLLFQVIFYSQLASEQKHFNFNAVVDVLTQKLIRRHPHVFPNGTLSSERRPGDDKEAKIISERWDQIKEQERAQKGQQALLDDVPKALPSLPRAQKLQKRVAKAGMDFRTEQAALKNIYVELQELESELAGAREPEAIQDELGDVLFSVVNLARKLDLNAEQSLRVSNHKFEARIKAMEELMLISGQSFSSCSDDELDALWQHAKSHKAV